MFIPRSSGAMATRLRGDLTLVIETQPGQPTQYCFSDERRQQDLDYEGKASGDQERLRRCAKVLADAAAKLDVRHGRTDQPGTIGN